MLALAKVDLARLKAGAPGVLPGTVFVLLLVHPMNQIQNPEPVEAVTAYHLDSWARDEPGQAAASQRPSRRGRGGARLISETKGERHDALLSLRRRDVDVGLPRLPVLSSEAAVRAFASNHSIYVHSAGGEGTGVVYRSRELAARYVLRGEREHLYHRYVELGAEGAALLDCVPFACKESAKEFPARLAAHREALLSYGESLFVPRSPPVPDSSAPHESRAPATDSSLHAWYASAAAQGTGTPRERLEASLRGCAPVVLYNMITQLRTKYKRDDRRGTSPTRGSVPCLAASDGEDVARVSPSGSPGPEPASTERASTSEPPGAPRDG
jgi:hypothetical protein